MSDIRITITEVEPVNIMITEVEPVSIVIQDSSVKRLIDLVDGPGLWAKNKFLMSTENGWVWADIPGGGDMLKAVYDQDNDGIVDKVNIVDGGEF